MSLFCTRLQLCIIPHTRTVIPVAVESTVGDFPFWFSLLLSLSLS